MKIMIADQNFYDTFFYFTISATAEDENCAYGPTLPHGFKKSRYQRFSISRNILLFLF